MRLLYFSPVAAASYPQRPHYMVRAWLNEGVDSVLWVEPYPCRLPRWSDLRRVRGRLGRNTGILPVPPKPRLEACASLATPFDGRITVLAPRALPIEPLPLGTGLNRRLLAAPHVAGDRGLRRRRAAGHWRGASFGDGVGSDPGVEAREQLLRRHGQFPEFHGGLSRPADRRHEDAIAAAVTLSASSTFLAEKFTRRGLRVEKILNGCDSDECRDAGRRLRSVRRRCCFSRGPHHGRPILGYLGCLGHWFDWRLVARLAMAVPHTAIELVGPWPRRRRHGSRRMSACCRRAVTLTR